MKKTILLLVLSLSISTSFAQRKKNTKKTKPVAISNIVLASSGNMVAEMSKNTFFITLDNKKAIKDTILLKVYSEKSLPTNCKLQSFTTKGKTLYFVSWVDNYQKNNPLIKENITETNSIVFDSETKSKVYRNAQKSTAISEIHFLDAKKTVSETIDRKRNEGFVCTLLPNGDINLKGKNQSENLTFDATKNQFVALKKK